jgi:hypothetical protein
MDSKLKKLVAGVALAGALTVGTAGVAVAAEGTGGSTPDPSAQVQRRHPWIRAAIRRGTIKVVTDTLGVSRQDLRQALQGGQTLGEYATSLGKEQAVVDALTNAATTKLDQLAANGKITPERAATAKSKLPERIDKLMNHQFGQHATT